MPPVIDGIPGRPGDGHDLIPTTERCEEFIERHPSTMTRFLSGVNSISGAPSEKIRVRLSVVADNVDPKKVAVRLRAVMADQELETVNEFADFLGANRSQASNWLQGYNLPPAHFMDVLCHRRPGLTLDWIYRGVADAVPTALAIKLEALTQNMEVPLVPPRDRDKVRGGGSASGPRASGGQRTRKRAI